MANLGILGTILDRATGGWGHYYNTLQDEKANQAKVQSLLGGMGLMPGAGPQNQGPDIPDVTSLLGSAPSRQPIDLMDPATQANLTRLAQLNPKLGAAVLNIAQAGQDKVTQGNDGRIYSTIKGNQVNRLPSHSVVNGFNVDLGAPDAPSYIPTLPTGMMPDGKGGVMNLPQLPQAMGEQAGAVAGANAAATAPYEFVNLPTRTGAPRVASRSAAMGGDFTGQSPAEATAAGIQATAGANAAVALPQDLATADQALATIENLRKSPALHDRTGMMGVLPAIPGTPGVAFDASLDQLKGKLFLEAYATLKGGGSITEVEGRKATDAIARLNRHQSEPDFLAALDDLQGVIQAGKARAAKKAAGTPGGAASGAPAARMSGAGFKIISVE